MQWIIIRASTTQYCCINLSHPRGRCERASLYPEAQLQVPREDIPFTPWSDRHQGHQGSLTARACYIYYHVTIATLKSALQGPHGRPPSNVCGPPRPLARLAHVNDEFPGMSLLGYLIPDIAWREIRGDPGRGWYWSSSGMILMLWAPGGGRILHKSPVKRTGGPLCSLHSCLLIIYSKDEIYTIKFWVWVWIIYLGNIKVNIIWKHADQIDLLFVFFFSKVATKQLGKVGIIFMAQTYTAFFIC